MTFDHDWWHGGDFERQLALARQACLEIRAGNGKHKKKSAKPPSTDETLLAELETRTVVYLRDGFSYEMKRLIDMKSTGYLSFECVAADQAYRAGAFVVSVPYEEVCRVETFAVHPSERPDETPTIRGFGGSRAPTAARGEERVPRHEGAEPEPTADDEESSE